MAAVRRKWRFTIVLSAKLNERYSYLQVRESNLSVPDADVLARLADALDTTVQSLLGQAEEAASAPSDVAAALSRINDQLAIQNRRRARVWKVIAWLLAVFAAFNVLLLVLGYAGMANYTGTVETQVFTVEDSVLIEE